MNEQTAMQLIFKYVGPPEVNSSSLKSLNQLVKIKKLTEINVSPAGLKAGRIH